MIENNYTTIQDFSTTDFKRIIPPNFRFFSVLSKNLTDLLSVVKYDRTQSELFLDCLQKGNKYSLDVSQDNRSLVHQLYFDAQNAIKTKGKNNLLVAYPFFYEKNEHGSIFSPLFLFEINLEPELSAHEAWKIQTSRERIFPNHYVFNYLKEKYGIDCYTIYNSMHDENDFSSIVKATVDAIAKSIGFELEYVPNKIFPVQDKDGLENELNDVGVYFNAIIGNLETPNVEFSAFDFSAIDDASYPTPFRYGLYGSDVAQHNALSRIKEQVTVLTGHAGTGKTHSISNFVSFALSKGKKVLVINNNQRALLQIQENLAKWNLDKFSFVVKNPDADKKVMLDILRAIESGTADKDKNFNFKNFEVKADGLSKLKEKLEQSYSHLQKGIPVAGNWQNLLGFSIKSSDLLGKNPILTQINSKLFSFQGDEYYILKDDLLEAQQLYAPLQTLNHPLSSLNNRIFTQLEKNEALNEVQSQLNVSQYDLLRLFNQGNQITDAYRQQQRNIYMTYYVDLTRQIDVLNGKIEENTQLYGNRFAKPNLWQSWFGNFSKKGKEINLALTDTRASYDALAKNFATKRFLPFIFQKNENIKPAKIAQSLKEFSPKLQEWNKGTEQRIEEEIYVLNPKFAVNFETNVTQLDEELHIAINQLNQSEVFTEKFNVPGHSLATNLKFMNLVLEKIKSTQKDMAAFDAFHPFRYFWLNSDDKTKHLVECAVAGKNDNWESAFDVWYYEQLLQNNYADNIPQHTDVQQDIIKKEEELMLDLANQISATSYNRRYELLRQYRKKSDAFNRVFGKNSQVFTPSMKALFNADFEAITENFPLILMTSDIANQVLDKQQFDYVFLDDAQQILLDQCGTLLNKGKQAVILGDPTEISSNASSLLYWALENQFETAELSMIHTTKSNAMNLFLDSIYPSDSLRLPIVNDKAQFIDIVNVMGRYDEAQNTNHAEAEQVLTILNLIKKTPLNRYPSIGIVTTTFEQRNLISHILLQLKQRRSTGFDKILQLERNNLGVYHWSEIEGQKFDIVIFSIGFGIKDGKGKLSEEIQFLNTNKGFNYLYQTMTRASQQLYLCHSIPYSYFDEFYESHTAKGTFLLSALIKFHQATQNADNQQQTNILQNVSEGLGSIKNQNENFFVQEMFAILEEKMSDRKLHLMSQIGSLSVPITIDKKEEYAPNIALRIDGTFTLPYTPNPVWEKSFEAQLQQLDYKIVDTWSANWWRNRNGEVQRILEVLENIEKEFAPIPEVEEIVEPSESIELMPDEALEIAELQEELVENQAVMEETIVQTPVLEHEEEIESEHELIHENEQAPSPSASERHHDNFTRPSEA